MQAYGLFPTTPLYISNTNRYHIPTMTAIVLLSGGQDSATCLAIAKQTHKTIHCVCFDYGQRHRIEIEASRTLAENATATFSCIDISFISKLSNSALVQPNTPITQLPNQLPSTFVPGRNALFLTIGAMIAHQHNAHIIYTGVCETDYSGYPDCRSDFITSQQKTLELAMKYNLTIETPLMHLTKAETVQLMAKLNCLDWYQHTHTCYEGKQPACGACPACILRKKGFNDAGFTDPIPYTN
jgi:7-cyano-7-deazaguanine synthase